MPPPNITGKLHIGHALFLSIQDALTRYYRKSGYETLWLPGTDHAGLATHDKIIESFNNADFSDDDYLIRGQEIKETHQSKIIQQIQRTGASCDWSRLNYTMDDNFKQAAIHALKQLNNDGLLYQKDGQWYIAMKEMATELLSDIQSGLFIINDITQLNKLIPMLEHSEDWCISRQIKWGLTLPIYIDHNNNHHIFDSDEEAHHQLPDGFLKETSTFDTWFTSSLWPFATLGWPNQTDDYKKFYPAQIIETGADILFFWCARMLMMGKKLTGIYPFREIYLHGICRDSQGRKMSKSLGNGIDPLDIIDKYGTDALRFALLSKATNKDMKMADNDFLNAAKFINKIWQSFRFIDMHMTQNNTAYIMNFDGSFTDHMKDLKCQFHNAMENRDFLNITRDIQYSYKHHFCDEWIEQNKKAIFSGDHAILQHGLFILISYMELLHCFMPFITTYITEHFGFDNIIGIPY
jgi:valyl-tRNA synthetase